MFVLFRSFYSFFHIYFSLYVFFPFYIPVFPIFSFVLLPLQCPILFLYSPFSLPPLIFRIISLPLDLYFSPLFKCLLDPCTIHISVTTRRILRYPLTLTHASGFGCRGNRNKGVWLGRGDLWAGPSLWSGTRRTNPTLDAPRHCGGVSSCPRTSSPPSVPGSETRQT